MSKLIKSAATPSIQKIRAATIPQHACRSIASKAPLPTNTNATPETTSNPHDSATSEAGAAEVEAGGTKSSKPKQTVAERDAALMVMMQDMDGGSGAVEEKEWNGMARNVKENMVSFQKFA